MMPLAALHGSSGLTAKWCRLSWQYLYHLWFKLHWIYHFGIYYIHLVKLVLFKLSEYKLCNVSGLYSVGFWVVYRNSPSSFTVGFACALLTKIHSANLSHYEKVAVWTLWYFLFCKFQHIVVYSLHKPFIGCYYYISFFPLSGYTLSFIEIFLPYARCMVEYIVKRCLQLMEVWLCCRKVFFTFFELWWWNQVHCICYFQYLLYAADSFLISLILAIRFTYFIQSLNAFSIFHQAHRSLLSFRRFRLWLSERTSWYIQGVSDIAFKVFYSNVLQ